MKKMSLFFLSALMATSILVGCGNNTQTEPEAVATEAPATEVIDLSDIGLEEPAPEVAEPVEEIPDDELPAGYVRSSLTNLPVSEDVYMHRPIAVMIPSDKVAQPQYNNSKAGVLYECLVEGSITRTMAIIEDWQGLDKIGNIRSARDYFIYWSFEWDAILLHDGGPFYINNLIGQETTNNISGRGFRDSSRSAPHNEYYSASIVNQYADSYGYTLWHRTEIWDYDHFKFAPNGGQTDLTANYSNTYEVATLDLSNCYPVTKTKFVYDPDTKLYYRYIYGAPHQDAATGEQLSFSNIILQNTYGYSRDDHDYRIYQCQDNTRDGWFITNGNAIHVTWEKKGDYKPTQYFDDNGNQVEMSTGKTMICVLQEGGSASLDAMFIDNSGNTAHPNGTN